MVEERSEYSSILPDGVAEPARRAAVTGSAYLRWRVVERHADTGRLGAELLERHAARRELVAPAGVDVAVQEVLAEPEAGRERRR